jgi:predicted esterase
MKKEHLLLLVPLVLVLVIFIARPGTQSAQSVEMQIKGLDARVEALLKDRPAEVSDGSVTTIIYHVEEARRFWEKESDYAKRSIAKAKKYLDRAEKGVDPLEEERGIVARAYKSPYAFLPQGYSVYVPDGYSKDRSYGLVLNLHGGSSTHNLFLGVTLGNWNIPWASYWQIRHDELTPLLKPENYLVAAPDGFGQIRWRWMAEMDVLSVVRDIRLHYNIDPRRIALCGLSNGGIGAYAIGTKYASDFSAVFSMAGLSNWLLFHKSSTMADWSIKINEMESGIFYACNAKNTYYHFVHGEKDAGPMKVDQARAMHQRLQELGIDHVYQEIPDFGHDIIWFLWGKGRIFNIVDKHPKQMHPREVWLEALSYRASRQHWIELLQMKKFLEPARIKAKVSGSGDLFEITTENIESLILHLFESPAGWTKKLKAAVDGQTVELGPVPGDGRVVLFREGETWKAAGAAEHKPSWSGKLRKTMGLSGPVTDINYERQIHVYGSQVAGETKALKSAAILGARNWMKAKQFVEVDFPVKSDEELTGEDVKNASLVLYGTFASNKWIRKIGDKLPIKITDKGIELRGKLLGAPDAGAVLIYPNPLNREKYVLLVTGNSLESVLKGNALLPFLPDYVVFDKHVPAKPIGMSVSKKVPFIAAGFFDEWWQLPP